MALLIISPIPWTGRSRRSIAVSKGQRRPSFCRPSQGNSLNEIVLWRSHAPPPRAIESRSVTIVSLIGVRHSGLRIPLGALKRSIEIYQQLNHNLRSNFTMVRYFLDPSAARGRERISSTFALSVGSFPCRYALRSGSLSFPQNISSSTANVGTPNTPA